MGGSLGRGLKFVGVWVRYFLRVQFETLGKIEFLGFQGRHRYKGGLVLRLGGCCKLRVCDLDYFRIRIVGWDYRCGQGRVCRVPE